MNSPAARYFEQLPRWPATGSKIQAFMSVGSIFLTFELAPGRPFTSSEYREFAGDH
jgi:hypothetical protein